MINEKELTNFYKPIIDEAEKYCFYVLNKRYDAKIGLKLSRLLTYKGEEYPYEYPIPVISIKGLLNFEFFVDKVVVTARIKLYDFNKLNLNLFKKYDTKFFGYKEYNYFFCDVFDDEDKINTAINKIKELDEKILGIQIYLKKDNLENDLINIIKLIKKDNLFYLNEDDQL